MTWSSPFPLFFFYLYPSNALVPTQFAAAAPSTTTRPPLILGVVDLTHLLDGEERVRNKHLRLSATFTTSWCVCVSFILNCFMCLLPVFALDCICVQTGVYLFDACVCLCATDGPGALHAHVGAALMPAVCVARPACVFCSRVCFLPACVCRGSVFSLRGDRESVLRPLMASERQKQQTESSEAHVGTRRAHKAKDEALWDFMVGFVFFKSKVTAELKVIHRLTHCCFYCLIKDNLVFPKVLYYILWV